MICEHARECLDCCTYLSGVAELLRKGEVTPVEAAEAIERLIKNHEKCKPANR